MNIRKNAEAIFLAAAVMGTFAAYATAEVPKVRAAKAAQLASAADSKMQVVVITGKRLTAAEKAELN
ncbi:hypothetical protein [Massilia cavernae]|uniref:Uncharacterized protein n=1 Tax=Massilia cavernae TaxID=2320864 RepID=A0A418Y531_9BURK|nr:hypothetical protein [Massilia cavernae]RJG21293.1 hypothetical protein D3872_07085 [Massilia cavernae]